MAEKRFLETLVEMKKDVSIFDELKSSWAIILSAIAMGVGSTFIRGSAGSLWIHLVASIIGSVIPIVLFMSLIKYFGRKTAEDVQMKKHIQSAFIKALDESSFNPAKGRSAQHD